MANTIIITKNADGSATYSQSGEEDISIALPVQLFIDNSSISFRVDSEVRSMKLSDSITIGGVLFSGTLSQLKTAVENILPGSAPATALPTEYPATYAAMQASITSDPTTKRDFFVSADEMNGGVATSYRYNGSSLVPTKSYGRDRLLLYHDFSNTPDGSPSGVVSQIGGITLNTTGTVPPTVTGGKLYSTGSGYLWAQFTTPVLMIEFEISFTGTPASTPSTLAICRTGSTDLLRDILHFTPTVDGADLTVRADTGAFPNVISTTWRHQMQTDGTKYRLRLAVLGNRALIFGPFGEVYTSYDPRIIGSIGSAPLAAFWQAASTARIHTIAVFGDAGTGVASFFDKLSASNTLAGKPDRIIAAPNSHSTVSIGSGNGSKSSFPTIGFGLPAGDMRGEILNDIAIGGTSITLPFSMFGFNTDIQLGVGDDAETVILSGQSGTGPYTYTMTAATKAHPIGTAFITNGSRYKEIYLDMATGVLIIPANTNVNGVLELGTNRDAGITRSAAKTIAPTSPSGGTAVFRNGSGTTANRLSASAVGAGAEYFDTTLNKPIWSNGTNWVDATGTTV